MKFIKKIERNRFKKLFKSKYFWIALIVLMVGISVNQLVSFHLRQKYGDTLPILSDFILDTLPYWNVIWLYDLLSIFPIVLIIFYAYKKDFNKIPYFILLFGILNLTRGIFIGLTPFGSPNNGAIGLFKGSAFRDGVYPSGHTGSAFLSYLLSTGWWKFVIFIFMLGIISTLLLGRGHYSIDIFSALLFSYAIYSFGEKYFKRKFVLR